MSFRPPQWHQVTALYGGTFDPPHQGHALAVRGLFREPGVRQVIVLPSAIPPHKSGSSSAEHRVAMARLAFGGLADVQVDTREIDRAQSGRPSYSYDTIQELRRDGGTLAFVIGTDQLEALHTWHRFPDLLGICHWIVLERKPGGDQQARRVLSQWEGSGICQAAGPGYWSLRGSEGLKTVLHLVPTPAPALSATDVRKELQRTGKAPAGALPQPVDEYLKTHRLYGTSA